MNSMPRELLYSQSENYVEYSETVKQLLFGIIRSTCMFTCCLTQGAVLKGQEEVIPKTKYAEDVYENKHFSVWGSYWKDGKWGYLCCHGMLRQAYCTGSSGKVCVCALTTNFCCNSDFVANIVDRWLRSRCSNAWTPETLVRQQNRPSRCSLHQLQCRIPKRKKTRNQSTTGNNEKRSEKKEKREKRPKRQQKSASEIHRPRMMALKKTLHRKTRKATTAERLTSQTPQSSRWILTESPLRTRKIPWPRYQQMSFCQWTERPSIQVRPCCWPYGHQSLSSPAVRLYMYVTVTDKESSQHASRRPAQPARPWTGPDTAARAGVS